MSNVLVATLGESPIVITAMVDKLTKQEGIKIDRVVVVYPQGKYVEDACEMVMGVLSPIQCDLVALPFEDANGKAESFQFLHELYKQLAECDHRREDVYLSLAGGRKNMSALMALLAPLFPCVKGLYHILDPDGKYFLDIIDLNGYPYSQLKRVLRPDIGKFVLVKIPFGEHQRVSKEFRSLLFTITDEQLDELWDKNPAEAKVVETYRQYRTGEYALSVWLTESVRDEYQRMRKKDMMSANEFKLCFERMSNPDRLKGALKDSGFTIGSRSFHFFKRRNTKERPFYHTEPENIELYVEDIRSRRKVQIDRVIISGMSVEQENGSYKPNKDELLGAYDPKETIVPLDALLSSSSVLSTNSVLIVPLGGTPMVATQFYALRQQKGRRIQEAVVLYPQKSLMVTNSLEKVREALKGEDVKLQEVPVPLEDLASSEDCEIYLQTLVSTIEETQARNPDCQIELSLSGGRKGMAALAMFAAQQTGLRYVYHTLIEDRELFKRVEKETDIKALNNEQIKQRRIDRLLLRAYSEDLEKFALFEVPVLPSAGK